MKYITILKNKEIRDCQSVEQFIEKYHEPESKKNFEYFKIIFENYKNDFEKYGFISLHPRDNITGYNISFTKKD